MGHDPNIGHDRFPEQGLHLGRRVEVCFGYDTSRLLGGRCIRDDAGEPYRTIFMLDDGRVVLATECQYAVGPDASEQVPTPPPARPVRMAPLQRVSGRDPRDDYVEVFALYLAQNAGMEFGQAVAVADRHVTTARPEADAEAWLAERAADRL